MIITIEGVDGAGKNTLTERLVARLTAAGRRVATLAYPRYDAEPLGPAIRTMLAGGGGLAAVSASPRATALMFALDRAASRPELDALLAASDVVLLDRYVASNAAYGAARLPTAERADFPAWIADLEFGSLGLPIPDLQVLLRVSTTQARADATARAAADPARLRDTFESDDGLQARCAHLYEELAAANWASPWLVVGRESGVDAILRELRITAS
ncbi:dTMP kinase [Frankia sp. AgPm24]|uniref:Thymidylate kinase n=1 Tax=Frankia umida TaxID=573489 RepID=A0ABT0JVM2_9ACTN|nr:MULTISPECIES: dTMP kinase [Frankia]MCK9875596.1 dTMP kinase [Frankia umida]MCK9923210.1 dTMP kinase [Frankia sp. AgPm24]